MSSTVEEREALLRAFFQFLSLGESELANAALAILGRSVEDARHQVVEHMLQWNTFPFEFLELASHQTARLRWMLASPLVNSPSPQARLLGLKAHLQMLMEGVKCDAASGNVTRIDITTVREAMESVWERLMSSSQRSGRRRSLDGGSLQGALSRMVRDCPQILGSVIEAFEMCRMEAPVAKEMSQFLAAVEKSAVAALDGAFRSGRVDEAFQIITEVPIKLRSNTEVSKALKNIVQHTSMERFTEVVQCLLASGSPTMLTALQQEIDAVLLKSDETPNPKQLFFPDDATNWRSVGFQEARVHDWHIEGIKLETVLKEVTLGRFDVLGKWQPGNRRLLALAALMGWDMLSAQNTSSTFPLKKQLIESVFPRVAAGNRSELSGAVGALCIKLRFSELMESVLRNAEQTVYGGSILTQLRVCSPQHILSHHVSHLTSDFMKALAQMMTSVAADVQLPVVRDFQLILGAGVISSVLAFLAVTAAIFSSDGAIPSQDLWIAELSDLVSCVHNCMCGMRSDCHRIWVLSIVNAFIALFMAQPELFESLQATFTANKNGNSAVPHSTASASDILTLMQELVDVLHEFAESVDVQPGSWIEGFVRAHQESVSRFYRNLKLGLHFLLQSGTKNFWKFISRGNWKELGGFLSLSHEAHELLVSQVQEFSRDANEMMSWSEVFARQGLTDELMRGIKDVPTALDVIVSKKLDISPSLEMLNFAIHCLSEPPLAETDPQKEELDRMVLRVCQQLRSVLEVVGSDDDQSERSVVDLFGKGPASRSGQVIKTSNEVHVRKVLEHLKAITSLRDALKDLRRGRLRYLSGLLHNLSRALVEDLSRLDSCALLEVSGCGPGLSVREETADSPSNASTASYLSQMVHYLAEVGDIVSTMDDGPTEGHNYFAMLQQSPQELLSTLIGNSLCANDIDHALAAAQVQGVDLAHEVLTDWLAPLYPPAKPSEISAAMVIEEERRMPSIEAMKQLIVTASVRVMMACAFAHIQQYQERSNAKSGRTEEGMIGQSQASATNVYEGRKPEPVVGCLATAYSADADLQFSALRNWVQQEQRRIDEKVRDDAEQEKLKSEISIQEQIEELLKSGSGLREALRLAERSFGPDLPDEILCVIVAATEQFPEDDEPDGFFFADEVQDPDPLNSVPVSWVACLKIKDKSLALKTASNRVHSWSLERAMEFYSLVDHPLAKSELKKLNLFQKILRSPLGGEFHHWTDVNALYERECSQLVRKVLASGATDCALELVNSRELAANVRMDVHAAHVEVLGQGAVCEGRGPLEAVRFLKSLSPLEAFEAGMKVLTSPSCPLNLSRLLVQYLMSIKIALPAKLGLRLQQTKLGIAALRCLPQQWSEKCAHLVETPSLIIESLVMAQQTVYLKEMMETVPSLRDDNLLIFYARKALGLGPDAEALPFFMESNDESLTTPQKLIHMASNASDSRFAFGLVPVTVLSGNHNSDAQVRAHHTFGEMPNMTLFRVLLDLLSSPQASAAAASRAAIDLAEAHLTNSYGELEWNAIVAHNIQEYVGVCLEVLSYAETKPFSDKSEGGLHLETQPESGKSAAEESSEKVTSAFMAGPSRPRTDLSLRKEVELMQKLLMAGIRVSLMDLRDKNQCEALLHRLVTAEQYHLSVQTARQCSMDERPYWEAWVIASIQEGNFISAREHVPYVFCIPVWVHMDSSRIRVEARQAALRLVRVLEMTCPVDMPAFFTLHNSLKQSRLGMKVRNSARELLKMVTGVGGSDYDLPFLETLGFNEKMKKKDMISVAASSTLLEERIQFCEELLAAYAPSLLIPFMFRHDRGGVACEVMYPAEMEDDVGPSSRSQRRRERAGSDRVSAAVSSQREHRGGSSMSSGPSEITSEPDMSSPKALSLHSSSSARVYGSKSPSTGFGETSLSQRNERGLHARRQSLPSNFGSSIVARQLPPLGQQLAESQSLINGVDPYMLAREVENVDQICDLAVRYNKVEDMVATMMAGGPRGTRALRESCKWLEGARHFRHLYQCQKALGRLDAAGKTCLRLSWMASAFETAQEYLESANVHFHDALDAVQRRGEGAAESKFILLTQTELSTLIARTKLQLLIYKELTSSSPPEGECSPKQWTMFIEADQPTEEDAARRMHIVQHLLVKNFSLGFRVMFEFRLSETMVYANTIESMALGRKHKAILDLVNNVKGTVSDQQLDRILFHGVSAYSARSAWQEDGEWIRWFAEGLVELMASPHAKVRAFLKLSNIEAAFKLAELHGARGDLSLVMEAAQESGHRSIVRSCAQILDRAHIRTAS